jgi:hypothetical protein
MFSCREWRSEVGVLIALYSLFWNVAFLMNRLDERTVWTLKSDCAMPWNSSDVW